jgi:hypothetical protein
METMKQMVRSAAEELASWLPGYVLPDTYYDEDGRPGCVIHTAHVKVSAYVWVESDTTPIWHVSAKIDGGSSTEYVGERSYCLKHGVHEIIGLLCQMARAGK